MKRPGPFHVLLGLSGLLLLIGLVYSIRGAWVDFGADARQAEAAGRAVADAERGSARAQAEFKTQRFEEADAAARAALAEARERLAACERRAATDGESRAALEDDLVKAAVGFGRWLDLHPGDVDVLLLRARAWEMRRFSEKAAADLRRAIERKPALAEPLAERLKQAQAGLPATTK